MAAHTPARLGLFLLSLCLTFTLGYAGTAQAVDTVQQSPHAAGGPLIGARYPALSPDGSVVVFEYWGDLWSAHVSTQYTATLEPARRLTDHLAFEQTPKVSPDGRWIAFVSERSGGSDIFVMPFEGGAARQITSFSGGESLSGWTPDGKLVFSTRRGLWGDDLFVIDPLHPEEPGEPLPQRLTVLDHYSSSSALKLPDGGWLYQRGGGRWWRKGYRGTAQADLWRMDAAGRRSRVTEHKGMDQWPMLHPNGEVCFYVTDENGIDNIWALNLGNGSRRQLTQHTHDGVQWPEISADGRWIAYEFDGRLWRVDTNSGDSRELALRVSAETKDNWTVKVSFDNKAEEFSASPDGKFVVIGFEGDLWGAKDPKQWKEDRDKPDQDLSRGWRLTESDGARDRMVAIAPDKRHIAYCCDADGDYDIYVMDLQTMRSEKLTETDEDDLSPQFDPTSSDVLFYYSGNRRIVRHDLKAKTESTVAEGRFRQAFGHSGFALSPDGKWVAYVNEMPNWSDEVFIAPSDGSAEPVNITRHPDDDSGPRFSADGRRLLYRSNRGDDWNLYVVDLSPEPDIFDTSFLKPGSDAEDDDEDEDDEDEKDDEDAGDKDDENGDTGAGAGKDEPANGEDKGTNGKDKDKDKDKKVEVKIDFRDIHLRARQVNQQRNPGSAILSPDGEYVLYEARPDERGQAVYAAKVEGGEAKKLLDGAWSGPEFTADGKRVFFLQDGTVKYMKYDEGESRGVEAVPCKCEFWLDKRARFGQMYREAWRTMREQFYDRNMHGVDWDAVYEKYLDEMRAAATPEEFGLIFSEVLGELNASHLGITMASRSYDGPGRSTGHLGLEFEEDYGGPGLKVSRLTYQGPADRPGIDIKPGDILLKVEGRELRPGTVWEPLLLDKAGQPMTLTLAPRAAAADDPKPVLDADGNRLVVLKPWTYDDYRNALYREWEIANEERCAAASGGRIGYIHIRGMSRSELDKFEREFYSEVFDKDALVIDVRFNPGGFIHEQLFELLDRKPFGFSQQRDAGKVQQPYGYFGKPLALLINASSGSDAEIFPAGWRELGLGPVIGIDTAGAVIGTTGFTLVDGTRVRLPVEGWFELDGRNLELSGTPPDIYVDVDPNELAAGRDAQLERAIAELLAKL